MVNSLRFTMYIFHPPGFYLHKMLNQLLLLVLNVAVILPLSVNSQDNCLDSKSYFVLRVNT